MSKAKVISMASVPTKRLANDSWIKLLITRETVQDNHASVGFSCFTPGTVTKPIAHKVEEFMMVVKGQGELRLNDECIPFKENDAIFVPPDIWHWVANTGDEDIIMVFGFAYYEYPPTQSC
ncbi:cupin domain-containing protein [Phosphitispora fastidiosa]|uniref:cupin domain-containing protein n=1 Tax=Phosphitispora fastidiosa TaxID=2837202 RepID=UPI001E5ADEA2|nr:cupin domain-containing protein [Phosphitispora fastidiosa]MBU7008651.1 quercetin dioxygenase-like cupin family protein [Phosphitispora fastidiosa]